MEKNFSNSDGNVTRSNLIRRRILCQVKLKKKIIGNNDLKIYE